MTIHNLFSVRDEALKAFNYPFINPTIDSARRSFGQAVNSEKPDNQFRLFPQDYSLFHVGTYDDETAKFENFLVPQRVACATDYIKAEVANDK